MHIYISQSTNFRIFILVAIKKCEGSPKPKNLNHYFSKASKKRALNVFKEYSKFLRVPKMGSLAGGMLISVILTFRLRAKPSSSPAIP